MAGIPLGLWGGISRHPNALGMDSVSHGQRVSPCFWIGEAAGHFGPPSCCGAFELLHMEPPAYGLKYSF
jgi:hypothetical protein